MEGTVAGAILEAVERLQAAIDEQARELTLLRRQAALLLRREEERARLQRLLPAIWAAIEENDFATSDLYCPHSGVARDVLEAAAPSPKAMGKLFDRWTEERIDFLRICRRGTNRDGAIWGLVSDFAPRVKSSNPFRE